MAKNSSILKEYNRVRKNLTAQINSLKRRGYNVPAGFIPDKPKNITAGSIRRLEHKKEQIPDKITYGPDKLDYGQGRYLERQAAAQKGAETRREKQGTRKQAPQRKREYVTYESPTEEAWTGRQIPEARTLTTGDVITQNQSAAAISPVIPDKAIGGVPYDSIIRQRAAVAERILAEAELNMDYPSEPELSVNLDADAERLTELMDAYLYGYLVDGYSFSATQSFIYEIQRQLTGHTLTAREKRMYSQQEEDIFDSIY